MKPFITLPMLLMCLALHAQQAAVLDRMAGKLGQFNALEMQFVITTLPAMPASMPDTALWSRTARGHLSLKGARFRLSLPRMQIWSDGGKVYQYIPEYKEINITSNEASDQVSLTSRPDLLLTQYNRYFDTDPVQKASGNGLQAWRMVPVKASDSPYSSLLLWVSTSSFMPVMICAEESSGAVTAVAFESLCENDQLKDSDFIFDRAAFPKDTELIDLTF